MAGLKNIEFTRKYYEKEKMLIFILLLEGGRTILFLLHLFKWL